MQAKESEHGKDQQFHSKVDGMQNREFLCVAVIGVWLEVAEIRHRTRMAFPARGHPVLADGEARLRIIDRQDVVRPMAVAAFRGRFVAQFSESPVQTHPIALG